MGMFTDRLLNVTEAALYLGLHPGTLNGWRSERKGITYLKIGGSIRYRESDLFKMKLEMRPDQTEALTVERAVSLFRYRAPLPDCLVCFIRTSDWQFMKIGIARKNVRLRLKALQTTSPFKLFLVAHVETEAAMEREFHRLFWAYHHHGEWFKITPVVRQFIELIA